MVTTPYFMTEYFELVQGHVSITMEGEREIVHQGIMYWRVKNGLQDVVIMTDVNTQDGALLVHNFVTIRRIKSMGVKG